jgi:hypothetical protein
MAANNASKTNPTLQQRDARAAAVKLEFQSIFQKSTKETKRAKTNDSSFSSFPPVQIMEV